MQFEEVLATQYSQGMACSRLGGLSKQETQEVFCGTCASGREEGKTCTGMVSTVGKRHTGLLVILKDGEATSETEGKVLWMVWNQSAARKPLNIILFSMCAYNNVEFKQTSQ